MAPRRRRFAPQGTPNLKAIAFQIVALLLALVAVLTLTHRFSTGSSHLVEFLTDDPDLNVEDPTPSGDQPASKQDEMEQTDGSSGPSSGPTQGTD